MKEFTVRSVDGSVDVDASVAAFRAALTCQMVESEKMASQIEAAVDAVFDEKGGRLPKEMLIDGVLSKLNVKADTHSSLTRATEEYLRFNTSKDKGVDGRRLAAVKGQKGGIQRLALPGEEVTPLVTETK